MSRSTVRCYLAMFGAVGLTGCGFRSAGTSPGGSGAAGRVTGVAGDHGGGTGGTGGPTGAGGTGAAGGTTSIATVDGSAKETSASPSPDAGNCGARNKVAMKVPPDILILLDRSGSMNDDVSNQMCRPDGGMGNIGGMGAGCGAESKWAKVIPAITQVVSETQMDVNWGLKFFPDNSGNMCSVTSTAAVPVAPGNGAAVAAAIMGATSANGGVVGYNGTPTRSAEAGATMYLQSLTDTGPKYILLATDGLPTCAATAGQGDDSAAAPGAVDAARTAGFKTFVVGVATGGGSADTTLSNMANAGGLPRAGTPTYYPVSSSADLAAAIRTLIGVAATCTFQIGPPPTSDGKTSLDHIDVFGDGVPITRDTTHANGYDYVDATMQSVQIYGPLCDQITSGAIHAVTVTFRCLIT